MQSATTSPIFSESDCEYAKHLSSDPLDLEMRKCFASYEHNTAFATITHFSSLIASGEFIDLNRIKNIETSNFTMITFAFLLLKVWI